MRSYAIIPAAGHSRRMGRHKLLLPFEGATILERVLSRWTASPVSEVVVVARRSDTGVQQVCRQLAVHTVTPAEDPGEMKISIQCGLRFIEQHFAPQETDVWLTAPADSPRLSPQVVAALLATRDHSKPAIVVPTHGGRRGHPVMFPWSSAREVFGLGPEQGVNALLELHPPFELPIEDSAILDDLDTPDDYQQLLQAEGADQLRPGVEEGGVEDGGE